MSRKEVIAFIRKNRDDLSSVEMSKVLGIKPSTIRNMAADNSIKLTKSKSAKKVPSFDFTSIADTIIDTIKHKNFLRHVPVPKYAISRRKEEASILDISDMHIGQVNKVWDDKTNSQIETYNYEIFKQELQTLLESIFSVHAKLSLSARLEKLWINVLGDIVTNDRIFAGQLFQIEMPVSTQILKGYAHLASFINELKRVYKEITVTCIVGNHGRPYKDYQDVPAEHNFEYLLYKILEAIFEKDSRVNIVVPKTYIHTVTIAGRKHLLMHGDTIPGYTSTSTYGLEKVIKELYTDIEGGFEFVDCGHRHYTDRKRIGSNIRYLQNSCWVLRDNYAFKKYKKTSYPEQWFYGSSKKRQMTWNYELDLRKR